MAESGTFWSFLGGISSGAAAIVAKSIWDRYAGWRSSIPIETWKIRVGQLERQLSQFYWPLYIRLVRDDVVWKKVFFDLRPRSDANPPNWVAQISEDNRRKISQEIEEKVLMPNHIEAVKIIHSFVHLARADAEFLEILAKYVRHVDAYSSLRSAGIMDADPIDVGEPYPTGLSEAVLTRLSKYQADYDELVRDQGMTDFKKDVESSIATAIRVAIEPRSPKAGSYDRKS